MGKKVFYGYWVLACCFFFAFIAESSIVVFGIFIKPIEASLGWGQTQIMGASTIFIIAGALASPFVGKFVEWYGARCIVSIGALITSIGLILLSKTNALWHFYLGYVFIGVGCVATGLISVTYTISNWFERKRGMALGIMSTGVGVSSIVFAPLCAVYLIPYLDWRGAYMALGVIHVAAVLPLSLTVLRTRPSDMGLYPDGITPPISNGIDGTAERSAAPFSGQGLSLTIAITTAAFWLIGISLLFNHTHLGAMQALFPHLVALGFSKSLSASAVGLLGLASTAGMFFFGWLCDKTTAPKSAAAGLAMIALGIMLIIMVSPGSPLWLICFAVVIMGFGIGSWMPTLSMMTSTTFGMVSYGPIFGVLNIFASAGAAFSPLLAGRVYDATRSYRWAFIVILVMVILAIPAALLVRKPRMMV